MISILLLCAAMPGLNRLSGIFRSAEAGIMDETPLWEPLSEQELEESKTGNFETELPVLYIDTGDAGISKESKVLCTIAMKAASETPRPVSGMPDETAYAAIKYRGATSYTNFDKKQYRIKFYQDKELTKKKEVGLFGMAGDSEWILNGPFLDKTLMRNKLAYDVSREIMEWAPDTRYCELFLNGEYQGVYLVAEPVTDGEGRLGLSQFGLLSGRTAFIVKRERKDTGEVLVNSYGTVEGRTVNRLYLQYPSADKVTDQELSWVTKRISDFERALYREDFAERGDYQKYIEVDSFVDYYIINEVFMNIDGGSLSTYIYEGLNGKMRLAVWDFNNALDNYQAGCLFTNGFVLRQNPWFDRLLEDPAFVTRVVERYYELREGALGEEHMLGLLQQYQEELGDAVSRNDMVWGYSYQLKLLDGFSPDFTDRNAGSYEEACRQMKETLHERLVFLDAHISDLQPPQ